MTTDRRNVPQGHRWRFFVQGAILAPGHVALSAEESSLARVVRLRAGEAVEVSDGAGTVAPAVVLGGGFDPVRLEIGIPWFVPPRPVPISLFVGLAKPAAIEELVESCVQLGADRIGFFASSAPLAAGRRGGPNDGCFNEREMVRLARIARESCRVSKRPWFCEINYRALAPAELLEQTASQSCSIMVCDEAPLHNFERPAASAGHAHLLGCVMGLERKPGGVLIVIGPESGLSEEDKSQLARHAQLKGLALDFVSLGSGILTVPNAARSALAQVEAALSLQKW